MTFHFDCTMNPCPRMVTLYSVQRRYVRAVRARLSLEWIMNHLFFTNDYIITGTRRAKTSLARERWTSKCHIWTRGSLPPTLREMHPVRHQVGNRAQKIILRLMQQHLMTMFSFFSRAKTKSQKIQNSTPRLPLLMSNKAKTDSERHLCGHCQLRRLHQSHRSLHGGRHP